MDPNTRGRYRVHDWTPLISFYGYVDCRYLLTFLFLLLTRRRSSRALLSCLCSREYFSYNSRLKHKRPADSPSILRGDFSIHNKRFERPLFVSLRYWRPPILEFLIFPVLARGFWRIFWSTGNLSASKLWA
ncbi:hypothetical protein A0H81_13764 [Grifola frondosa]|uniref:Transmembrane protein n=1 Tax=Grifola frondosa TaxID=5627 RepID=A0A1C7LNE2_GRIFR|nr:hypothetical protein A0H81_13764 [Grifola frondosa]